MLNVALSSWRPWCHEADCADDPLCTFPTGYSANLTTSIQRGSALPIFQMGSEVPREARTAKDTAKDTEQGLSTS